MIGLVLEGGGHRGIYTAGVLDVLSENSIHVDAVIGVSAGAIHGISFISGQIGRSIRYTEKYCADPRYMGIRSFLKTGDFFNVDFCYNRLPNELDRFDNDLFEASKIPLYVVCTNAVTGQPVYHQCKSVRGDNMKWLQASASMPLASKSVKIGNLSLFDGGVSDSIPLEYFEKLGFTKNIVVLTQPREYKKTKSRIFPLIRYSMRKTPDFVTTMENRHIVYNNQKEYVYRQEKAGNVLVIAPTKIPEAGRTEKSSEKIRATYNLGRTDCLSSIIKIRNFCSFKQ